MEFIQKIKEEELLLLREEVKKHESEKRYLHTLAVEKEIAALAQIFLPHKTNALRAAALLHDVTKGKTDEEQLAICASHAIMLDSISSASPNIWHALTAAAMIPELFPRFADEEILSAVRRHTVGAPNMTLFDKLLFLADFIEPTRRWDACRALRAEFWQKIDEGKIDMHRILDDAVIASLGFTISFLALRQEVIVRDTIETYHALLLARRES